ncbi:MAG: nitrophenyl compound nitroreductase subunit ArsF family protein [Pirellulales bacterium]
MFAKKFIMVGLLLFVGVTVAAMATKALQHSNVPQSPRSTAQDSNDEEMASPHDGVTVYYFHGNFRCPTCRTIEAYAQEAVETGFAEELARGELRWQVLNYEEAEAEDLVDRYQIVAPSVIISKVAGGQEMRWRDLDKVWQKTGDKAEFSRYVQEELKTLRDQTAGGFGQ